MIHSYEQKLEETDNIIENDPSRVHSCPNRDFHHLLPRRSTSVLRDYRIQSNLKKQDQPQAIYPRKTEQKIHKLSKFAINQNHYNDTNAQIGHLSFSLVFHDEKKLPTYLSWNRL